MGKRCRCRLIVKKEGMEGYLVATVGLYTIDLLLECQRPISNIRQKVFCRFVKTKFYLSRRTLLELSSNFSGRESTLVKNVGLIGKHWVAKTFPSRGKFSFCLKKVAEKWKKKRIDWEIFWSFCPVFFVAADSFKITFNYRVFFFVSFANIQLAPVFRNLSPLLCQFWAKCLRNWFSNEIMRHFAFVQ